MNWFSGYLIITKPDGTYERTFDLSFDQATDIVQSWPNKEDTFMYHPYPTQLTKDTY